MPELSVVGYLYIHNMGGVRAAPKTALSFMITIFVSSEQRTIFSGSLAVDQFIHSTTNDAKSRELQSEVSTDNDNTKVPVKTYLRETTRGSSLSLLYCNPSMILLRINSGRFCPTSK